MSALLQCCELSDVCSGSKAVSLKASRNFRFTPKSRHLCERQLHRRRKGRRCRGVFEKGEEIVFGPDGGLERDTGKDQEIVASALAHGRGGSPDWLLQPMDCLAGAPPCHNQPAERRANASPHTALDLRQSSERPASSSIVAARIIEAS